MKEKIKETNDRNGYREVGEKDTKKAPPPKKPTSFKRSGRELVKDFSC